MIKLLYNQDIPQKKRYEFDSNEVLSRAVQLLEPCDGMAGDCLEISFNPAPTQSALYAKNITIISRQVDTFKWRVWRKS